MGVRAARGERERAGKSQVPTRKVAGIQPLVASILPQVTAGRQAANSVSKRTRLSESRPASKKVHGSASSFYSST